MYAMFYFINTSSQVVVHVSVRYMETSYHFVYVLVRNIEKATILHYVCRSHSMICHMLSHLIHSVSSCTNSAEVER